MSQYQHSPSSGSARERELEIEVARLQAELDTLKGEDPSTATSRFLAMAAATVDRAVEDARREADEIVDEISAEAEARRDEATRVAAEAEAMTEQLLADADRAQERIDAANEEAAAIRVAAEADAAALVQIEREKVAGEIEALAEVRGALEDERGQLESYHEELRRRVHELAESMVSFMTTEPPFGAVSAIDELVPPQLEAVLARQPSPASGADDEDDREALDTDTIDDEGADLFEGLLDDEDDEDDDTAEIVDAGDRSGEVLEAAIAGDGAYPDAMEMPDDAIDEIPPGPPTHFADRAIADASEAGAGAKPAGGSLFARATAEEAGGDTAEVDPAPTESSGLFGRFGSRLVEQTSPDDLAAALDDDESADAAFHQFLAGDDEPDPSRDWLLRPEQS